MSRSQMNLEDFQGVPLREWIAQDATRREIKRRFQSFLLTFQVCAAVENAGKRLHSCKCGDRVTALSELRM